jgi:hypothetical protein
MSAPAVAVLADGKKFVAAWKDKRTGEPNVFWAMSDTPSFSQDDLVHRDMKGEQNHPSITMDSSGTVWAAWEDSRSGHQQIWARSSSASNSERLVSDRSEGKASFPVVTCNAGLVAVVYEAKKDHKDAVVFRRLDRRQR